MAHQHLSMVGWAIKFLDRWDGSSPSGLVGGSSITWTGQRTLPPQRVCQKMIRGHTHFQGLLVDAMGWLIHHMDRCWMSHEGLCHLEWVLVCIFWACCELLHIPLIALTPLCDLLYSCFPARCLLLYLRQPCQVYKSPHRRIYSIIIIALFHPFFI